MTTITLDPLSAIPAPGTAVEVYRHDTRDSRWRVILPQLPVRYVARPVGTPMPAIGHHDVTETYLLIGTGIVTAEGTVEVS